MASSQPTYRLILVPLDGSRFAEHALPTALGLARRGGARLELVMVREPPVGVAAHTAPIGVTDSRELEAPPQAFADYLDAVAKRLYESGAAQGVGLSHSVLSGPTVKALTTRIRNTFPDLVVMTTHGRGPVSRAWLGSVADGLVRRIRTPLLLLRPDPDASLDLGAERHVRHILIPLDGSAEAETILNRAVALGKLTGADYTLLRGMPIPYQIGSPYVPHDVKINVEKLEKARRDTLAYLAGVADPLRRQGLKVETEFFLGVYPASGILEFAEKQGIDLIAMATHGRGGVIRLVLGSVADKVLRGSPVPLLVYRPERA
ncbi:MAG: universal stress protein [Gemmatimonadetes bacterium]|nr:universal stress protein [Gemmatimonadota bacterium]